MCRNTNIPILLYVRLIYTLILHLIVYFFTLQSLLCFSGVSRGFLMLVYKFGHPHYVHKLMRNSKVKISLIWILGDKTFIAIVSKHCKKFNFALYLFELVLCAFCILLLILMFSKHFYTEAINLTKIHTCLKESLNVNM